jgi:hypothetical protein
MDYFQGVVTEYLRADRAMFVNAECCIQLNANPNPDNSGPHWYCDAVAVSFRSKCVYLCEITYSKSVTALMKRLADWATHWDQLKQALVRDCSLPTDWPVQPWLFVPTDLQPLLERKLTTLRGVGLEAHFMPAPKITELESVLPWKYKSWNRVPEDANIDV